VARFGEENFMSDVLFCHSPDFRWSRILVD
jgi:hypothetical protein